jgi:hypothetical protein
MIIRFFSHSPNGAQRNDERSILTQRQEGKIEAKGESAIS